MRVPLFQPGGSGRTMSRIPSGGYAVLDIARPLRPEVEGALSKKAVRFLPVLGPDYYFRLLCWSLTRSFRRMGLGDFVCALDVREFDSRQQSACQIEAPFHRRTPFMHLVDINTTSKSANRSKTDLCVDHHDLGILEGR